MSATPSHVPSSRLNDYSGSIPTYTDAEEYLPGELDIDVSDLGEFASESFEKTLAWLNNEPYASTSANQHDYYDESEF